MLQLLRGYAAAAAPEPVAVETLSAEHIFTDLHEELVGLHRVLNVEELLGCLPPTPAEQIRARLRALLGRARRRGGEGRRTAAAGHGAPGSLRGTEPARLPHPDGQALAAPAADHQAAAVVRRRGLTLLLAGVTHRAAHRPRSPASRSPSAARRRGGCPHPVSGSRTPRPCPQP